LITNWEMGKPWFQLVAVSLCRKVLGDKWTKGFYRQKGVEHALDHICNSLNFVAVGISRWLCGWWTHSYPVGRCHHRASGPTHSGTKNIVALWTHKPAKEGDQFL